MVKNLIFKICFLLCSFYSLQAQVPVFKICAAVHSAEKEVISCSRELYYQFSTDISEALKHDLSESLKIEYRVLDSNEIKLLSGYEQYPLVGEKLKPHIQKLARLLSDKNYGQKFSLIVSSKSGPGKKNAQWATLSLEEAVHFPVPSGFKSANKSIERAGFRNIFDQLAVRFTDSLNLHTYEAFTAKFHFIDGNLTTIEYLEPPLQPSIVQPLIKKYRLALQENFEPDDWEKAADFYMMAGLNTTLRAQSSRVKEEIDSGAVLNYYATKLNLLIDHKDTAGYRHSLFNSAPYMRYATNNGEPAFETEKFGAIGLNRSDFTYFNGRYHKHSAAKNEAEPHSFKFEISVPWQPASDDTCYSETEHDWQRKYSCFKNRFANNYAQNYYHPDMAKTLGLMGSGMIVFTVDKNGEFKNLRVLTKAHPIVTMAFLNTLLKTDLINGPFKMNGKAIEMELHQPFSVILR